jgi:hypothetical protein
MNIKRIIKSLNLTDGEVLTLEKLADRMEFEMFSGIAGMQKEANIDVCGIFVTGEHCLNCENYVLPHCSTVCECDSPMGYTIDCNPYTYTN